MKYKIILILGLGCDDLHLNVHFKRIPRFGYHSQWVLSNLNQINWVLARDLTQLHVTTRWDLPAFSPSSLFDPIKGLNYVLDLLASIFHAGTQAMYKTLQFHLGLN